jgi:SAM-dependent methyltransferase
MRESTADPSPPGTDKFEPMDGWEWDPSLYEGSAPFYTPGRLPYPMELAEILRHELALDGSGRLLDVGCGPGSLTLILAALFDEAVGVDADAAMLAEADHRAHQLGIANVRWRCQRAEALPDALGAFRLITMAQCFHWMDRPLVAATLSEMLEPDGALVHVGATTHRGVDDADLPGPAPPRDRIDELVVSYLGPLRRAGRGVLPAGTPSDEDAVFAGAGFVGPRRLTVVGGQIFARTEDEIVASVFSLSSASPHLFGDHLDAFELDHRALLRQGSPTGEFWERLGDIGLSIWTKP